MNRIAAELQGSIVLCVLLFVLWLRKLEPLTINVVNLNGLWGTIARPVAWVGLTRGPKSQLGLLRQSDRLISIQASLNLSASKRAGTNYSSSFTSRSCQSLDLMP